MSTRQKLKKVICTIEPFSTLETIGISSFTSHNITSFLLNFKLAYKNHYITIKERVVMLLYYYNSFRKVEIKTLLKVIKEN